MAQHIEGMVLRGEIDNRRRGRVTGTLWLVGEDDPMRLDLLGDACPDLAGCLLKFRARSRHAAAAKPREAISRLQRGAAGELTASLRLMEPSCSLEEMNRIAAEGGEVPLQHVNALYLEWYNEEGQRVVLETTDFELEISDPAWSPTPEDEEARAEASRSSFHGYLDSRHTPEIVAQADDLPEPGPMDEFQWEQMLKESDKKSDRFAEVLKKYDGHPDSERLMAREMGWSWVEDELDAEERGLTDGDEEDGEDLDLDEDDDPFDLQPDPLTEGVNWIRDEEGDIQHPIAHRAFRLGVRIWRYADEFDLIGENRPRVVTDLVSSAQLCSAKLAGALNGLAYDLRPEHGLIVASLKRALGHLNLALQAAAEARAVPTLDAHTLEQWQAQLFELRESILKLMDEHRRQMPS